MIPACAFAVVIVAAMVCYCQHSPCTLPGCKACKRKFPEHE